LENPNAKIIDQQVNLAYESKIAQKPGRF